MEQHLLPLRARPHAFSKILLAWFFVLGCSGAKAGAGEHALMSAADEPGALANTAAESDPKSAGNAGGDGDATVASTTAHESAELPAGTLVLHVGDSFAGSLGQPLAKRMKAAGLRYLLEYLDASYIPTWASAPELNKYLAKNPDLVIVTLGANEFELSVPETRANTVKRLVRRFEGRPCVWVTPPRWKPDTGILNVIHENLKPCRFLDSDTIVTGLPRRKDGIHPNDEGRELWAEAVLTWLIRERKTGAERPWEFRQE